jgi:Ca2+-dependent lipid-binding protein
LQGGEIHGADRSGTSDPYVVITLNGEKVHKTETKKKTLTPVWNETCECTIPSRVGAEMILEVYDWNQIGQDESIGKAPIDLAALEPFHPIQINVPLENRKHGQKGFVTIRMIFTPQIIAKSRKSTSTFSTAGRAVTQVGNAPVAVGKGVIGGVGVAGKGVAGGVGAVGKGVKGLFGGRKGSDADASLLASAPVIQEPPSTQITEPIAGAPATASSHATGYTLDNSSQTFPKTPTSGNPMEGVLRVTVQSGKDLADSDGDQVRPYVMLSMGGKKFETKHLSKTNNAEW